MTKLRIIKKDNKESMPLISVVLPTYNRASLLPRAIKSVLSQTYKNFELIIIDDNSSDNTKEIVKCFKDKRIKYIRHKENKGGAAARNAGIKLAKGKYIAFQDSDDKWLLRKLEKQIQVIRNLPLEYAVVYSGSWYVEKGKRKYVPSSVINKKEGNIHRSLLRENFITIQAMVRKDRLIKVGMFDERLPCYQDWDLWLRLSQNYLFKFIKEPLSIIYCSSNSISKNNDSLLKALIYLTEKHHEDFKREKDLLSEYYFTIGNMFFVKKDFENGKRYFIKAKNLKTLDIRFLISAPIIIFAPRLYVKLLLLIRRVKDL